MDEVNKYAIDKSMYVNDLEKCKSLEIENNLHQMKAKAMQDKLKSDITESQKPGSTTDVISFDLQQTMPTPNRENRFFKLWRLC